MTNEEAQERERRRTTVQIYAHDKVRLADISARIMRQRFLETQSARQVTPADAIQTLIDESEENEETIKRLEDQVQQLEAKLAACSCPDRAEPVELDVELPPAGPDRCPSASSLEA